MSKPTAEVSQIPCRLHVGPSGESFACPSDCPRDGQPQFVGQHNTVMDNGSAAPAIEPPVLTTIELRALSRRIIAAEAGDRAAQKELGYFSPSVLVDIINELINSRKLLRKASLSKQNNSQPNPIIPIGGGRYVDLSRVQDIEPKKDQVCLTLVSGAVAWAPIEMTGELIQAWQAIRRAQVWGKKP